MTQVNEDTKLIGDSLIRDQLDELCSRSKNYHHHCFPRAKLNHIINSYENTTANSTENTLIIIHAGTNDIKETKSEALLAKYREMIRKYKMKSSNIIISGILPRINASSSFYDKASSTNRRLTNLCREKGVDFINLWDQFYNKSSLFRHDGLHLNPVDSARFGRLLHTAVSIFMSKNVYQATIPSTS